MEKHHFKIPVLIFILVAAIAVIFLSQKMQKSESAQYTPSLAEAEETPLLSSVISPEGKMTLNMKSERVEAGTKYSFSIKDSATGAENEIFYKTVSGGVTISIPANTFSPDNKYIFLRETNGIADSYFVITTSGEPITEDLQAYDISSPFSVKYPDLTVTEMTGWGGINLIVINTSRANGVKGPSYWFDVPSKSFIQLSSRFD